MYVRILFNSFPPSRIGRHTSYSPIQRLQSYDNILSNEKVSIALSVRTLQNKPRRAMQRNGNSLAHLRSVPHSVPYAPLVVSLQTKS